MYENVCVLRIHVVVYYVMRENGRIWLYFECSHSYFSSTSWNYLRNDCGRDCGLPLSFLPLVVLQRSHKSSSVLLDSVYNTHSPLNIFERWKLYFHVVSVWHIVFGLVYYNPLIISYVLLFLAPSVIIGTSRSYNYSLFISRMETNWSRLQCEVIQLLKSI